MYILDFFRNLIRKSNTYVLIYLIFNLLFITFVTHIILGQQDFFMSFITAMILYAISLTLALSPIGEWILRKQLGAHEIKRMDYKEYFDPIFQEVYTKAKLADPSLPNDIKLFMNNDKSPNAFATGRKTVCLTEGILDKPIDELKAVLAHEFGHLSHRDTDILLVVTVGNFIFTALISFIKIMITIIGILFSIYNRQFRYIITSFLTVITINILMWAWTKIGTILIMKSSRENEFEADKFASNLGYGNSLCSLLDSFGTSDEKGLFALLASSHPDTNERIFKLQELGATYRSNRFSNLQNQNVQIQQVNFKNQQQFQHNGQAFQQNNFANQQQFQHNGQAFQQNNFANQQQFQHNRQAFQQNNFTNQQQFQHNGQTFQQNNFTNQQQFQHNRQAFQQNNFANQQQFQHNGQAFQQQAVLINQGQQLEQTGQTHQQTYHSNEGIQLQQNGQNYENHIVEQDTSNSTFKNTDNTHTNPFGDVAIKKVTTQENNKIITTPEPSVKAEDSTKNEQSTTLENTSIKKEPVIQEKVKLETSKTEKTQPVNPFGDQVFKK